MAEIELYVCCHRQDQQVPGHPLLVPIQVGAALAEKRFKGYIQDDCGENISAKNCNYCELTALYWAWKNCNSDSVGLFHYRRYMYPNLCAKRPYVLKREPTLKCLEHLKYDRMADIIAGYDVILPKRENMYLTVREHYAAAPFHHEKDLELVESIIRDHYPTYIPAMEEYLASTELYFGNIFIMNRQLLDDYCRWLFDILERFDQEADLDGYCQQELRVDGYLAERLLGIYVCAHRNRLKLLELPRVHFLPGAAYWKTGAINFLLPPGTKRRALVKRWMKR